MKNPFVVKALIWAGAALAVLVWWIGGVSMAEYKIQIEDIPEQYSDIVRALGLEKFIALCDLSGGEVIYIPMLKSLANAARNGEIYKRFTGGNIRQLAAQYKLSQRQIRRIIEGQKRLAKDGDSK